MNGKKIFILFCLLLFPGIIFAQDISHGKLNFEEFDGTPSVYPYKMKVTNGTLTDNLDGTASLDFPGAMAYPGAGIVVSNGTAWGTSIPDNSTNWDAAYGWGNHSSAGYIKNLTSFTTDNLTQGSTNKYANTTKEDNGQTAYTWGDQSGKADYNFTSNNFNGTGNFTSTGIISGSNLSGNNTGDETNSTILSKLGFTPYYPGGTDVAVSDGGTGKSSWTQYLIPYANTTTSFDQIPIGTSGQVLTSNGAGSVASFQDATSGNPFNQVLNTTSNVTFGTVNGNSTTQSQGNNSTLLSTTAYVDTGLATKQANLTAPMVYGDSRYIIINFSRDMAGTGADVAYTGVGFQPKMIYFFGTEGVYSSFWGVDSITTKFSQATINNDIMTTATTFSLTLYGATGNNEQYGKVKTFDSDGFTITWAKAGTPTGTATIVAVCFR